MKTNAIFSECRKYRYALWRVWDDSKPCAMFIGLNPSTSDETEDYPTIKRCINYAKDWGYGGLCMGNLFAFRETDPNEMMSSEEPVGSENDDWLVKLSKNAGTVIAVWGNSGSYLGRSKLVIDIVPNLMCLKVNKIGEPAHALYQPKSAKPVKIST